eukprot:Amastigsp_a8242_19.p2 type:complete len:277 gc:universal Amastigsp_a8242_19:94-924(+)
MDRSVPYTADPHDDLRVLRNLFDHNWISGADYKRIRYEIQDRCFGKGTDTYRKMEESHAQKRALGLPVPRKVYHRKKGPRGPQRCSVCHLPRRSHECSKIPCASIDCCGVERLHRTEMPEVSGDGAMRSKRRASSALDSQSGDSSEENFDYEPRARPTKRRRVEEPDDDEPSSDSGRGRGARSHAKGASAKKVSGFSAALGAFQTSVKCPCPAKVDGAQVTIVSTRVIDDRLYVVLANGETVEALHVHPLGSSSEAKANRNTLREYEVFVDQMINA